MCVCVCACACVCVCVCVCASVSLSIYNPSQKIDVTQNQFFEYFLRVRIYNFSFPRLFAIESLKYVV